jgi:hypothetical protein
MIIKIYPDEIIKLTLWHSYVYYVVGSDKEAERILKDNNEIELSVKDALVIGLLKTIETTNLIHKFNTHITELLSNKSINKDGLLIRKKTLDLAIEGYVDRFPDYWEPNSAWVNALKELVVYIDELQALIVKLDITEIEDKNVIYEFYNSNQVKKLLKFSY